MKTYLLPLIIILLFANNSKLLSQQIAKGIVFEDLNNNHKFDRNEKGIANVAVSNGSEVVLTNTRGEYQLQVVPDNIIFIIKPSGYSVSVNEYNQPQFWYNYKPNGSPKLKYPGVAPTGTLPKSIDFGLIPAPNSDTFKMLVFGDPQANDEKDMDFFYKGIVKEVEGVKNVSFGLSLGDLVWDDLSMHKSYKNTIKHIGVPWYNVIGNHDENYDVKADSLSDESFENEFGPATYSFNQGMVHFIILDDILYPDPRDNQGYWGGFRPDQLTFIENDLKYVPKDHLIVLAFHIPLTEEIEDDAFRDQDRTRLFELLKNYPYTLSLSAHTHYQSQDFFGSSEGWLQQKPHHHFNVGASCGDWYRGKTDENGVPYATMRDGTRKGYVFLQFDKNRYSAIYKVAGKPADYQFEIYAPKVLEQNKHTTAGIVVNFFMGRQTDEIYCRIDTGEWKKMRYIYDYDPSYMHYLQEWDYTEVLMNGERPSNPVKCDHLWFSPINSGLPIGEHAIEIKATDMYGQTLTQKSSYRIETKKE